MRKIEIINGVKKLITDCEKVVNNPEFFEDTEIESTRKVMFYLEHILLVVKQQDKENKNLRLDLEMLKNVTQTYDAVKFEEPFIKNAKIVIADKEFFDKGCFRVNLISKKDIQKKIDNLEFLKTYDKTNFKMDYKLEDLFDFTIEQLKELL